MDVSLRLRPQPCHERKVTDCGCKYTDVPYDIPLALFLIPLTLRVPQERLIDEVTHSADASEEDPRTGYSAT